MLVARRSGSIDLEDRRTDVLGDFSEGERVLGWIFLVHDWDAWPLGCLCVGLRLRWFFRLH